MSAIHHVSKRADALPWLILQPNRPHHFAINGCDLLTGAQVSDGRQTSDPECDATTGAAPVEAEHKARPLRCSPVDERIHAQCSMLADRACGHLFDKFEAWPPHQRAIAKHPEVAFGQFRF